MFSSSFTRKKKKQLIGGFRFEILIWKIQQWLIQDEMKNIKLL